MLEAGPGKRLQLVGGAAVAVLIFAAYIAYAVMLPRQHQTTEFTEQRDLVVGLPAAARASSLDDVVTMEDYEVMSKVHLGLVTADSAGRVFPGLAASWTVLKDGLEFVFHLRSDLSFPDGARAECADALRTFETLSAHRGDPNFPAVNLMATMGCKSSRDFFIRLSQQSPFFLNELADIRYAIRSPLAEAHPFKGLGPYALEDWDRNSGAMKLRRRANHPLLNARSPETIDFRVTSYGDAQVQLANGSMHLYPLRGRRPSDARVIDSNRRDRVWMLIMSKGFSLQNRAVSSCVAAKIDRQAILTEIDDRSFIETATLVPVSPATLLSSREDRQILQDDCARYGGRRVRFMRSAQADPRIYQPILRELGRLGLHVTEKISDSQSDVMERLADTDYELALFSAGVSPASPATDLASYYVRSESFPPSHWVDPLTSRIAQELSRARSEFEVRDMMTTLIGRTLHKGPFLPLFFETERFLAGRCIQVTDYDAFRLNQQFGAVERQRNCL